MWGRLEVAITTVPSSHHPLHWILVFGLTETPNLVTSSQARYRTASSRTHSTLFVIAGSFYLKVPKILVGDILILTRLPDLSIGTLYLEGWHPLSVKCVAEAVKLNEGQGSLKAKIRAGREACFVLS